MAKKTLFDYLNNICVDKLSITNDDTDYTPYMINRFVSMSHLYVPMVNEINKYQLPSTVHNEYMCSVLPKRKQYFKYLKKPKEDKNYTKNIECLCRYYEIGKKEAELYLDMLSKEQIKEITDLYETR